jgi:hypothetical protein
MSEKEEGKTVRQKLLMENDLDFKQNLKWKNKQLH